MSSTAFRAHRARRCSATPCVHGGRIRPGDLIIRRHRRYVHVDDIAAAFLAIARAARQASADVVSFQHAITVVVNDIPAADALRARLVPRETRSQLRNR